MSDGFSFWYTCPLDRDGVERVLHVLDTHGARLPHPRSKTVTVITAGPDYWGEQLPVERSELIGLRTLADRNEVNFQLWLNEETDMFTRFRRLADGWLAVEFGLDGMSGAEQEAAIEAVSHVVDTDRDGTRGVVVDRRGVTEETNWDGVMLGSPVEIAAWPDLLGVRPEVAARHPQLRDVSGVAEPPLVVYGGRAGG